METYLKALTVIPGIGPNVAKDLWSLGIKTPDDLKEKDPEGLYEELNNKLGYRTDPCVLYTFRCAVYYASNTKHDTELLKWWNWKDKTKL